MPPKKQHVTHIGFLSGYIVLCTSITSHLPERSAYLPQFEILTEPLKSLHSCWPAIRCKSQSYQASARDLGSDNTPFITVRLNLNYFSPHHYVFIRLDGLPGDAGMSKILVGISFRIGPQFSRIIVGIFQNLMGTSPHVPIPSDGPMLRRL